MTPALLWQSQVERTLATIERMSKVPIVHGDAWRTGTIDYYRAKLGDMVAHPPRGCQVKAAAYRKRLIALSQGRGKE